MARPQALKPAPKIPREYRRRKGSVPATAIFMGMAFFAVLLLFWGAPIMETLAPGN